MQLDNDIFIRDSHRLEKPSRQSPCIQTASGRLYYIIGHDDIEEDEKDEFTDGSVHVHYDR